MSFVSSNIASFTTLIIAFLFLFYGEQLGKLKSDSNTNRLVEDHTAVKQKLYKNTDYGIEFQYPDSFLIGRYTPEDSKIPDDGQIVLVERSLLHDIAVAELPIGELSTIAITRHRGREARFYLSFILPDYVHRIGSYNVAKLPGFPGPYGESAYYYILVRSDTLIFDFVGHKTRFNLIAGISGDTSGYDVVIENIISSFAFSSD